MSNSPRHLLKALAIGASVGSIVACHAPTPTAEPDCASQLRFHGSTYTAYRFTHQHAKEVGLAIPLCSGKVVNGGHHVAVWSLREEPPTKALVRQVAPHRFTIYLADSLTRAQRDQILRHGAG